MKRHSVRKIGGVLASAACICGYSNMAVAQTASSNVVDPPASGVEDIIVTAERRSSSLQSTPLAISALSGDELQTRQITDIQSLARALPSVDFGAISGQARIAIRGIGFDSLAFGSEARVAYHVDGVYLSRPASIGATFFDIERTEVLRGPQGTLYGRNATGGAINVITAAPSATLEGYGTIDIGNHQAVRTEGAVGGPLARGVSGRIAFQTVDRAGYGKNIVTGHDVDDRRTRAVRAKLSFEPSETFHLTISGDYAREDDAAFSSHVTGKFYPNVTLPGVRLGGQVATNPRDVAAVFDPTNDRSFAGAMAEASLDLGNLTLTSISAYRYSRLETRFENNGTTIPLTDYRNFERSRQYSQEIRVAGDSGRVSWLLGGYYFKENLFAATVAGLSPALLNQSNPLALRAGLYAAGGLKTEAYAGFGQLKYELSDRLALTLGGRYSWERKSVNEASRTSFAEPFTGSLDFPAGAVRQQAASTDKAFTPKVSVEFKPADRVLLYASISKGFKSGGFNVGNAQPAFRPEKITDYEIGLKADWFDGRLRTNLAAFYYDYEDLQVTSVRTVGVATVAFIENAASARIKGLEAEITAIPVEGLRLDLGYAFLDSAYRNYRSIDQIQPLPNNTPRDLSGNQLSQAPRHTLNFGAEKEVDTNIGKFVARLEGRWTDRVYFTAFNIDAASRPPNTVLNAFLTYTPTSGAWTVRAYVRNLTNKYVVATQYVGGAIVGYPVFSTAEPPRLFGGAVTYRF